MDSLLQLAVMLAVVLSIAGIFMRAISAFASSQVVRRHRARVDKPARIEPAVHLRNVIANSVVSTGLIFGVTLTLGSRLFVTHAVGLLRILGEAAAILAIYDLGYYLLHRFALHQWSVGRRIHAVHHSIRTPYAIDSLYVHPAETAAGVGLFLGATAVVGPVEPWSFGLALLVYSVLNIFIHSAVEVPYLRLRWLSAMVRRHDVHHESMKAGYYASMTPLWDLVFGTTRRPVAVVEDEATRGA